MSIIGAFVEHNRYSFGAVQHSIIGRFLSIIGAPLAMGRGTERWLVIMGSGHVIQVKLTH